VPAKYRVYIHTHRSVGWEVPCISEPKIHPSTFTQSQPHVYTNERRCISWLPSLANNRLGDIVSRRGAQIGERAVVLLLALRASVQN
jgi:hypothetical protein